MPLTCDEIWGQGLSHVVAAASADVPLGRRESLRREISDAGALASHALHESDEPLGRCMNHATQTLAAAVESASLGIGDGLKKRVIETAKYSASIPAILAYAGRVVAPDGEDPVDFACVFMWDTLRADIEPVREAEAVIGVAEDPVCALRACASLWSLGEPSWASRPRPA